MMTDKEPTKGIIVPVMPDTDLPTNLQGKKADIIIMPEALQRRGLLSPALSSALHDIKPVVISLTAHDVTAARKAALELIHQKDDMSGMLLEAHAVLAKSLTPEMTEMLNEVQMKVNRQQAQESTIAVPTIGGDYDGDVTCGTVVHVVSRIKKGPGKGRLVKRRLYKGFKLVWGADALCSTGPLSDALMPYCNGLKPERMMMFGPHVEQTAMKQGDAE